jgi:hypothetical protein
VSTRAISIATAALLLLLGCGGGGGGGNGDDDDQETCLTSLPSCNSLPFPATFDNIYDQVLIKSCGSSSTGTSCHYGPTDDKAQHGLVLSDPDVAYDHLLGMTKDGRARVMPMDAKCSILMERLQSMDPSFRMPVGSQPLPVGERCAISEWIEQGAKRK